MYNLLKIKKVQICLEVSKQYQQQQLVVSTNSKSEKNSAICRDESPASGIFCPFL